jgi:hypothetical protein
LKSFGAGLLQSLTDSDDQKKERQNFAFKKQREGRDKNLQIEGAEEASLYCKEKTHYCRQAKKTTKGKRLIDLN